MTSFVYKFDNDYKLKTQYMHNTCQSVAAKYTE